MFGSAGSSNWIDVWYFFSFLFFIFKKLYGYVVDYTKDIVLVGLTE